MIPNPRGLQRQHRRSGQPWRNALALKIADVKIAEPAQHCLNKLASAVSELSTVAESLENFP